MIDDEIFLRHSSERVRKAFQIAKIAHAGQIDKAGQDYIEHPKFVASRVGDNESAIIVALLHDFLEDFLTDEECTAIKLLTHEKNVPYFDYIRRIKTNDLARQVKLADLEHNSDLSRIAEPSQKDLDRLEKYKQAKKILEAV